MNRILNFLYRLYAICFSSPFFQKWNKFLYNLSLRGLGILNYQNDFLSGEGKFVKNMLSDKNKQVVFDVGANVGNYSKKILASSKNATVYAFEPHPANYKSLVNNTWKNCNHKKKSNY